MTVTATTRPYHKKVAYRYFLIRRVQIHDYDYQFIYCNSEPQHKLNRRLQVAYTRLVALHLVQVDFNLILIKNLCSRGFSKVSVLVDKA